jgi:hypothetical protein
LRCNPKWRVSITTNRQEKITAARITFIICCVIKITKFYYHFYLNLLLFYYIYIFIKIIVNLNKND